MEAAPITNATFSAADAAQTQVVLEYGWDEDEGQIDYFIGICLIELKKLEDAISYLSKASEAGKEDSVKPWLEYIQYLKDTAG